MNNLLYVKDYIQDQMSPLYVLKTYAYSLDTVPQTWVDIFKKTHNIPSAMSSGDFIL